MFDSHEACLKVCLSCYLPRSLQAIYPYPTRRCLRHRRSAHRRRSRPRRCCPVRLPRRSHRRCQIYGSGGARRLPVAVSDSFVAAPDGTGMPPSLRHHEEEQMKGTGGQAGDTFAPQGFLGRMTEISPSTGRVGDGAPLIASSACVWWRALSPCKRPRPPAAFFDSTLTAFFTPLCRAALVS